MEFGDVPVALRDRLGVEASGGLVELFNQAREEMREETVTLAVERFERRLVQETSGLRVDMAQGFAAVRQEMAEGLAAVRQEMAEGLAAVRQEMAEGLAAVRQEMAQGFAAIRQEMAAQRIELGDRIADLYKWSFLFWIGQLAAMAALLSFMLRR
ncbi:MAG: LA_3696 family protein [Vicinamibacterales bacterium]